MDGFTPIRHLGSDPAIALVPVIFLTDLTDAKARLKGFHLGADGSGSVVQGEFDRIGLPSPLTILEMEGNTGTLLVRREASRDTALA